MKVIKVKKVDVYGESKELSKLLREFDFHIKQLRATDFSNTYDAKKAEDEMFKIRVVLNRIIVNAKNGLAHIDKFN